MGSERIISPNLDQTNQIPQNSIRLNQSRVKFEAITYNPNEPKKPKGNLFGKILGGFGHLFAPFAAVAPFLGPAAPLALIGGLTGAGVGAIGDSINAKATTNQVAAGQQAPVQVGYPGVSVASSQNDPVMDLVLTSRENALYSSSQKMK